VSSQILQNYTITAMWYGVWAKMPYHTTFVMKKFELQSYRSRRKL
jgi:hypothetical protein